MEKVINIGGVNVKLSNNIGWAMDYKDQYGIDIVQQLLPMAESITETLAAVVGDCGIEGLTPQMIAAALQGRTLDVMVPLMQMSFTDLIIGITWAMAKAADSKIDPPRQWVRQFENFYVDEIAPEVLRLVKTGTASSKNWERLEGMLADIRKGAEKSASTKSSSQVLSAV